MILDHFIKPLSANGINYMKEEEWMDVKKYKNYYVEAYIFQEL